MSGIKVESESISNNIEWKNILDHNTNLVNDTLIGDFHDFWNVDEDAPSEWRGYLGIWLYKMYQFTGDIYYKNQGQFWANKLIEMQVYNPSDPEGHGLFRSGGPPNRPRISEWSDSNGLIQGIATEGLYYFWKLTGNETVRARFRLACELTMRLSVNASGVIKVPCYWFYDSVKKDWSASVYDDMYLASKPNAIAPLWYYYLDTGNETYAKYAVQLTKQLCRNSGYLPQGHFKFGHYAEMMYLLEELPRNAYRQALLDSFTKSADLLKTNTDQNGKITIEGNDCRFAALNQYIWLISVLGNIEKLDSYDEVLQKWMNYSYAYAVYKNINTPYDGFYLAFSWSGDEKTQSLPEIWNSLYFSLGAREYLEHFYPSKPPSYCNLTIISSTEGSTTPSPGVYKYLNGTLAKITAMPSSGYRFDHWTLDNNTEVFNNPLYLLMDKNHTLTPSFKIYRPISKMIAVDSNSTITDFYFSASNKTVNLSLSGPSGTIGQTVITLSKNSLPSIVGLRVFLNGKETSYNAREEDQTWVVYLNYPH
jgi:hypothetical protein